MKNLFKKLMLVAVAAMAFTACSQDVNEVNKVEKVTRYEFTANIADDTRSGFAEKEEGATAYKSEWHEGDQVKIFIDGYNDPVVTDIDTEGKFELELTNAPETFFMTVCAPANAWTGVYGWTVPTEQTPLANSVDPKAHILRSTENLIVSNGVASVQMSHFASYGKMTVNGVDFKINKVEVSFNGGTTYTINATNVQNNTFWFAISENLTVSEFTVTAYGEGDSVVTKTVSMEGKEKPLAFSWGRVSTFSVSGLEAVVAPEEPKALVFTSAKWANTDASDKLVKFYTADGATLQLNWYNCGSDNWIVPNTYGFANSGAIYPGGQYSWYKNTAAGIDTEIVRGSVMVSVVNGQYYIEFSNMADYDGVVIEAATFTGLISGLKVPDMRTALATPNVTSSVDGKMITLSWDAVEGAESYKVFCATTSAIAEVNTTETTVTIEAPEYSKQYEFMVTAIAADTDPDYKSSEAKTIKVTTDKDPNKFADVVATSISWNGSGYFDLSAPGFSYINLQVNSANRPDNKSLLIGNYTYGQNANQFRIKYNNGYLFTYSDTSAQSTMEVSFVDGEYVILINVVANYSSGFSGTIGYKGMPEGWVAPANIGDSGDSGDSGDEGDSGEDVGDGFIQMTKLYYRDSAANLHNFVLENADKSNKIVISMNNQDALTTWIPQYTYTSQGINIANGNPGYFTLQYDDAKINGTSYQLNATGHTLKVISSSNGGNHELELTVATTSGEYKFKFSGSLGM